ncbi:MAG: CHAT domain-containing protein [Synechococcaceae cyanobacterium RL_1_2]|nr:CHAT domain-containing protein [Synechococcaceae cyanobacterium RL_1_2]
MALAGANAWFKGKNLPSEAGNGLLLAQDVVSLDLWNTDLVVLSACQTGMGDIKAGEGVFGLRRAFTIAGAKNRDYEPVECARPGHGPVDGLPLR